MTDLEKYQQVLTMHQDGYSLSLICKKLNLPRHTASSIVANPKAAMQKVNGASQTISISKEQLAELVKNSVSLREIIGKINGITSGTPSGNSYRVIKKLIGEYGIDASQLLGKAHSKNKKLGPGSNRIPTEDILVENSSYQTSKLSKRLREENLLSYRCSNCGLGDFWNGKEITLHLDHINGNSRDHQLENLRFLCPNCHSQTETYCGRNAKSSLAMVKFRDKPIKERRNKRKKFFCKDCRKEVCNSKSTRCEQCYQQSQLRANYPSGEELLNMVKEKGYVQVGKLFGVSDNAIRNRLKKFGVPLP